MNKLLFWSFLTASILGLYATAWLTAGLHEIKGAAGAILAVLFLCLTMDAIDYFERRKK